MWVIEYTAYNNFINEFWTSRKREAVGVAKELAKLKHISNVSVKKR